MKYREKLYIIRYPEASRNMFLLALSVIIKPQQLSDGKTFFG